MIIFFAQVKNFGLTQAELTQKTGKRTRQKISDAVIAFFVLGIMMYFRYVEWITTARGKDIAERLGIQRGSVTGALRSLEVKGLIHYEPYGFILTRKGRKLAEEIYRKHLVLKDFLLNILRIDPDTAEETACRMEHGIDKKTLERLVCFIDYIHKCPRAGEDWIKSFVSFCESDEKDRETCNECINELKAIHA